MTLKNQVFFNTNFILPAILLFFFASSVPAVFKLHKENDELVYQTLVNNVLKNPMNYSLQGARVLKVLPAEYGKPV